MKHIKSRNKLEKTSSHRAALLSNMANSIIRHSRIVTTLPKAKEFRKVIEPLVTRAKENTLHAKKEVLRVLKHPALLGKLFNTIAPKFKERPGGYTRIIRLGRRMNDNAEMAIIEFVENFIEKKETQPEQSVKTSGKTPVPAPAAKQPASAAKTDQKKTEKPAKKGAKKKPGK